jgi:small-conductance mechanosensitive channel
MTTIRLVSGELVVMPNSVLFKNPVEVLTSQPKRRVTIITGSRRIITGAIIGLYVL